MSNQLFIELSAEQQETVIGGASLIYDNLSDSSYKNLLAISVNTTNAGPNGSSTTSASELSITTTNAFQNVFAEVPASFLG